MNMTPEEERDALVDRYVNGKLSPQEREEFEVRMMDEPALFDQLQVVVAMKEALRHEPAVTATTPDSSKGMILPFRQWIRHPLSLAASVAIAVLTVQFIGIGGNDSGIMEVNSVVLIENTRGETVLQFTGLPPYLFQVDVGLGNQTDSFNLSLLNSTTNEIALEQTALRADASGWLRVVMSRHLVGEHELKLEWTDESGSAQSRNFALNFSE